MTTPVARALCLLVLAASALAFAGQPPHSQKKLSTPWVGKEAKAETVAQIMARDHGEGNRPGVKMTEHNGPDREHLPMNPLSPPVSQWPPAGGSFAATQGDDGATKPPPSAYSVGQSWLGGTQAEAGGLIPPDSMGAIGPTQFLMCVNGIIRVFSKTGTVGALNTTTLNFFNSVRGGGGVSDPRVRYDRLTQRWFVVMINVFINSNLIMIAVSDGPTITGSTVWHFFSFAQDAVAPIGNVGGFADWPTLGVDANALYIGCNMFTDGTQNGQYAGTTGWVVRKSSVLGTGPLVATAFRGLAGASGAGVQAPMGVDNDDPTATVGYFLGPDNGSFGLLTMRRVSDPGGTPTISGNIFLTVPTTYWPVVVPQTGSNVTLDALDDRIFQAQVRTNRLTGEKTIWAAHNVRTGATGVAGSGGDRTATRWYQIANFNTTPTLTQAGTVYDSAASNPKFYWMGTVAMTGQGHMVAGLGYSSLNDHPSVGYTSRLSGDTLGTTAVPTSAFASSSVYYTGSGTIRWGDYSNTSVDPTDDMTVWTIQEYCSSTNQWGVRIYQLLAPPPATIVNLSPNTAAQGATLNVTVNGSSVAGSGFFDPGAGFPNHLQAAFSGTGITVNSVTFNNPTQATLNITIAAGATVGTRDLTITNPDGQTTTLPAAFTVTTGTVTVNPTSFTTFRGVFQSGGLTDLFLSDDSYVAWKPGFVLSSAEAPVDVFVNATSPLASPTTLQFTLEGKSTVTNVGQTLSLFNYVTNAWEQVDFRGATTADQVVTVTVSSNASRFVNPSDLAMRARVAYKATGPVLSYPWTIRIDQTIWRITP